MNSLDMLQVVIVSVGFAITTVLCHNLTQLWNDVAPEQPRKKKRVTKKGQGTYKGK